MKKIVLFLLCLTTSALHAQRPQEIKLEPKWNGYGFSGLAEWGHNILFIAERKKTAVYYASKSDIKAVIDGNLNKVTLKTLDVKGLNAIAPDDFDGIEAGVVIDNNLYLAIEGKADCYIVKAAIKGNVITVNKSIKLPKPCDDEDKNSGFESLAWLNGKIIAVFEGCSGNLYTTKILSTDLKVVDSSIAPSPATGRFSDGYGKNGELWMLNVHRKDKKEKNYIISYRSDNGNFSKMASSQEISTGDDYVLEGLVPFSEGHLNGHLIICDDSNGSSGKGRLFAYLPSPSPAPAGEPPPPIPDTPTASARAVINNSADVHTVDNWKPYAYNTFRNKLKRDGDTIKITSASIQTDCLHTIDTTYCVSYKTTMVRQYVRRKRGKNGAARISDKNYISSVHWFASYKEKGRLMSKEISAGVRYPMLERPLQRLRLANGTHDTSKSDSSWTNEYFPDSNLIYRRDFRKIWERYQFARNKTFWVFGGSYTSGWAFRGIHVYAPQFTNQENLENRRQAERSVYGDAITFSAGLTLTRGNLLSVDGILINQGFQSDSGLSWKTGLGTAASSQRYQFRGLGFGLLYSYSGYNRLINPAVDLGVYTIWNNEFRVNGDEYLMNRSTGFKPQTFMFRSGLGLNVRPVYWCDIRLMATLFYDLSAVNRGTELRSNLYNLGFTLGFRTFLPFK